MKLDTSLHEQIININQIGAFLHSVPRSQTVILQCLETSSLAFTLQTTLLKEGPVTGAGFFNTICQSHYGKRHFESQSIAPSAGERLYLDGAAVHGLKLNVTAGTGKMLVRATEALMPRIEPTVLVHSIIADGTDELSVKATPGMFHGIFAYTVDATPVYAKVYDKASAASEADTPIWRGMVPANSTAANGAGSNAPFGKPVYCSLGISVRYVTGLADNSDAALTAAENLLNLHYE